MRTVELTAAAAGDLDAGTIVLRAAELADPERAARAVERAEARAVPLLLPDAVRFGTGPAEDAAVLRLLAAATAGHVDVRWRLAGTPPWPERTLVHLRPPTGAADDAGERYAGPWRAGHRFGLCTYRRGPGFVALRDVRPGATRVRATVGGPWIPEFDALLSGTARPGGELLDALLAAGLVLPLDTDRYVLLPYRLRRWPVPYTAV